MVMRLFHPTVLPIDNSLSRRTMLQRLGRGGLVLAAATAGPSLAHAQTPETSPGPMAAITEAWTAAWNSHDAAQVAALFTADGVYEDLAFDLYARGTDEITAFAEGFFTAAPDLHIDLLSGFATDEWAAAEWLFSGTDTGGVSGTPTGKRFEVRGATIFELENGKARRNTDYYNASTVLEQLGLVPVAGTPEA